MKKYLFLTVFVLISCKIFTQSTIEWSGNYGGSLGDFSGEVIQTNDEGYILVGYTYSEDGDVESKKGEADFWIIRLNKLGEILWNKTYGGSKLDYAFEIKEIADNEYIVLGISESNDGDLAENHGDFDTWLLKIDGNGEIIWKKNFPKKYDSLELTSDNGFIIAGGGYEGIRVVKLDDSGNILWENSHTNGDEERVSTILHTRNGGYIIGGSKKSTEIEEDQDAYILKLNEIGEIEWEKTIGTKAFDVISTVIQSVDGNFIFSGYIIKRFSDTDGVVWILKLTEKGDFVWERTFGDNKIELTYSSANTKDGNFIFAGTLKKNRDGINIKNKYWVIKVDANGNLIWETLYGGTEEDIATSIYPTTDNGYILLGTSESIDGDVKENNGHSDIWVVKLSPDFKRIENSEERLIMLRVYPNPSRGNIIVETEKPGVKIDVFSMAGVKIKTAESVGMQIDVKNLEEGIYFLKVENQDETTYSKIIIR